MVPFKNLYYSLPVHLNTTKLCNIDCHYELVFLYNLHETEEIFLNVMKI
jgi:hypothetical protein